MFRAYFLGWLGVRVEGLEHVPRRGAFMLCSNHISWMDPPLLGAVSPRHLAFMTKAEVFASPVVAMILRTVGAFPVRRHSADRPAMRYAMGLLQRGQAICLFPEGTRSRDGRLGRAEPGAALIAARTGAPIVPVAICGTYRRGHLVIRFGAAEPLLTPGEDRPGGADLQRLAQERIMGRIADLQRDA